MLPETSFPRALVTGATGFVGGSLVKRLLTEGWRVRVLVRDVGKLDGELALACEIIEGDLANHQALASAVRGTEVIFHCAANAATWDTFEAYEQVNVAGVDNLLRAIAAVPQPLPRLVHVSTVDVYGYPESPADEDSPQHGAGFGYGESKLRGELLLRKRCAAMGIPWTVIRPGNVIGPGSQFIERIGKELKSGLMLTIDGGRAHAGLVYVDNLVDCMLWASRAETAAGQSYNVRDPHNVNWADFISEYRKAIDGKGWVIDLPFSLADIAAVFVEWFYRIFLPNREPILHRLLVRIFGRTCGHSADKILAHGGPQARVGFADAVASSAHWFLEQRPER